MLADLYRYRRYTTHRISDSFLVRIHPFLQSLTFIIPVVAQIMFWKAVFAAGAGEIGGYTVSDTILYLIIIKLIDELTWAYPGHMQSEIRFGELTEYLVLPASYIKIKYFGHVGNMVTRWMNVIILIVIVYLLFYDDIHPSSELWIYPVGLFSVVLTFHLEFYISLCIAFLSFWTETHPPLIGHISKVFGGSLVPLTFLPVGLQSIAEVLPFQIHALLPCLRATGEGLSRDVRPRPGPAVCVDRSIRMPCPNRMEVMS